jgi:hypothetical protein
MGRPKISAPLTMNQPISKSSQNSSFQVNSGGFTQKTNKNKDFLAEYNNLQRKIVSNLDVNANDVIAKNLLSDREIEDLKVTIVGIMQVAQGAIQSNRGQNRSPLRATV